VRDGDAASNSRCRTTSSTTCWARRTAAAICVSEATSC
jgi:hypothetical protein